MPTQAIGHSHGNPRQLTSEAPGTPYGLAQPTFRGTQPVFASFEIPGAIRDRLSDEVVEELLAGARTEEEIVGPGGVLAQLTKQLVERAMSTELSEHLGYEPHSRAARRSR